MWRKDSATVVDNRQYIIEQDITVSFVRIENRLLKTLIFIFIFNNDDAFK